MDWNPAYSWLVLALLLSLAELTSGAMVLLALGIAAALTAAVTALGLSLPWQLLSMGIFAGGAGAVRRDGDSATLLPPKGLPTAPPVPASKKGNRYTTLLREYDQATGIKVNGDFYRLRVLESGQTELPEGTQVVFKRFEGTTALVNLTTSDTDDHSRATPQES